MNNNIMLDIETMGNRSNSAIVAIGAQKFDNDGLVGVGFYQNVSLESSVGIGLEMDASTVMWWMEQGDSAREGLYLPNTHSSIERALHDFSDWVGSGATIWGNGAGFDNVILRNAYFLSGINVPWNFWMDRCYRTMKSIYPDVGLERDGTHHNALDDAKTQALHLIGICEKYNVAL